MPVSLLETHAGGCTPLAKPQPGETEGAALPHVDRAVRREEGEPLAGGRVGRLFMGGDFPRKKIWEPQGWERSNDAKASCWLGPLGDEKSLISLA